MPTEEGDGYDPILMLPTTFPISCLQTVVQCLEKKNLKLHEWYTWRYFEQYSPTPNMHNSICTRSYETAL